MSGRRGARRPRRRGRRQILLHRRFAFRRVGSELSRGVRWVVVTSTHGKRRITFLILLGIEIVRLCNDAHYKNITNAVVVVLGRPWSSSQSSTRATPVRVVRNPSRARTARTATPSRVVLAPRVVRDVSIPIGGTNPKRTNVARRRLAASRRQRRRRASTGASQASRAVRLVKFIPPLFLLQIYSFNQH